MRLLGLILMLPMLASAALTRVYVMERSDVLGGKPLGPAGAYERIIAKAQFELDPKLPANRAIRDLELAPRNERGMVEFTADLYVLKPMDPAKGNGTLLFEVSNRGGKGMLGRFQYAAGSNDPRTEAQFGDLSLMKQGYTLAWLGWQWDVPQRGEADAKLLRLDAPVARMAGETITGLVRSEFIPVKRAEVMPLSDRDHLAYAAVADQGMEVTLSVRESANGPRRPLSGWGFTADRTAIEMKTGFEPGRIYEVVYRAKEPRVQGVGLAAVRDFAAFMKYDGSALSVLGDQRQFLKRAIAFGISQSGRFLRTFLYYGFNADEKGRKAFDGVWADVAGAGRGSFNHRFAQASRDGYAHFNLFYPTDLFPFTDSAYADAATGFTDGVLAHLPEAAMPKIVYTNGGAEYWERAAALIHLTPDGKADAAVPGNVRIYSQSSTQHGVGLFPPRRNNTKYVVNPVDFRPFQRAVLSALHLWVKDGVEPPASRYPKLSEGQLVTVDRLKFPKLAGVTVPQRPKPAYRMDYGPDFAEKGIVTKEPPVLGAAFPVLVPQVDGDGLDLGGIRPPEVAVPLGTYTGWNLRAVEIGAPQELAGLTGSFFPFSPAEAKKRYGSLEGYLVKAGKAVDGLIAERFLLPEDKPRVMDRAKAMWELVAAGKVQ